MRTLDYLKDVLSAIPHGRNVQELLPDTWLAANPEKRWHSSAEVQALALSRKRTPQRFKAGVPTCCGVSRFARPRL